MQPAAAQTQETPPAAGGSEPQPAPAAPAKPAAAAETASSSSAPAGENGSSEVYADPADVYAEPQSSSAEPQAPDVVYFPNCAAAAAAGYTHIPSSSPAYQPELDEDGNGVACE